MPFGDRGNVVHVPVAPDEHIALFGRQIGEKAVDGFSEVHLVHPLRDGIAAAARALIDYRIANRDAMMDHYEQVMNSRTKGTEGHLLKLVPEVLKERGGMTPRSGLGAYN